VLEISNFLLRFCHKFAAFVGKLPLFASPISLTQYAANENSTSMLFDYG